MRLSKSSFGVLLLSLALSITTLLIPLDKAFASTYGTPAVCTTPLETNWLAGLYTVVTNTSEPNLYTGGFTPAVLFQTTSSVIQVDLAAATNTPTSANSPQLEIGTSAIAFVGGSSTSKTFRTKDVSGTWTNVGQASLAAYASSGTLDSYQCIYAVINYPPDAGGNTFSPAINTYWPVNPGQYWNGLTLQAVPSAPSISATTTSSEAVVTWNAPSSHPAITGYTLKRDGTTVYTGTNQSYTDTGLTSGTSYTYVLTATNSIGDSAGSGALTVTPSSGGGGGGGLTEDELIDGLKQYFTPRVKETIALAIVGYLTVVIAAQFRWRWW